MLLRTAYAVLIAISLSACASNWKTSYEPVPAAQATALRITAIEVDVPKSLKSSESNALLPGGDIVWRGEPAGDRHAQVAAIFRDAASKGAAGLNGRTSAKLLIRVERFHGVTPRSRALSGNVGVFSIRFVAQLVDAKTGQPLSAPQTIVADKPSLVGKQAKEADARGYTQKVEVTDHLTQVFRNWLGGRGADPRGTFTRTGS